MTVGGLIALILGVDAEGRSLEEIATPLSASGPPTMPSRAA
jgi:hypothetical protein